MNNYTLKVGSIVTSVKGHDSGRQYIVTELTDANFIKVADGVYHKLEKPKRKRIKHIKPLYIEANLSGRLDDNKLHTELLKIVKSKQK